MQHRCTLFAIAVIVSLSAAAHATVEATPTASTERCNEARRLAIALEGDFIKDGLINPIEGDVIDVTPKWVTSPITRQTQWLTEIATALYTQAERCESPPSPDTGRITRTLLVELNSNKPLVGSISTTTVTDDSPISTFVAWSDWYWDERVRAEAGGS